jgi:hypothetical protein
MLPRQKGASPNAESEIFVIMTLEGARKRPFCFYTYWVIVICQAPHTESGKDSNVLQLTLAEAIKTKRLTEFVREHPLGEAMSTL